MRILVVNTGSTSIKLNLREFDGSGHASLHSSTYHYENTKQAELLDRFLAHSGTPDVVVHRIVHGGTELHESSVIDDAVIRGIEHASKLAPLHNPAALHWIRICAERLDKPQVAVFDTAFFHNLPDVARNYAIPSSAVKKHGLRRYGFHGIAHKAMWQRWSELRPDLAGGGRLISIQLGGGCSVTATKNGAPQDTSMGFSPTEGLVMATRSGDLDPAAILHLIRHANMSPEKVEQWINKESGLLGLSGKSADMRELIDSEAPESRLAVSLYGYRLRKYIGAYLAVLEGADGIVFSGGVGEHMPHVRKIVLQDMQWCGIQLDDIANNQADGGEAKISSVMSSVDIRVLPADESAVLAEEAYRVITS